MGLLILSPTAFRRIISLRVHRSASCGGFWPRSVLRTLAGALLEIDYTCTCMKSIKIFRRASIDDTCPSAYSNFMKKQDQSASEAARQLSLLGATKGGEARAKKLSAERRREIGRAAIQARWEKAGKLPLPVATHKGNVKGDFGIDVDCYVLN